ncbi:MAG TPA: rhodanese-like domain-containing protein [Actinomycetales bacterium]|jgi:rhodanese-related sulfurtransferase
MTDAPAIAVDQLPADAVLLDVREPDEWAAGHAGGALHVPLADVPARLGDLPPAAPLYVICRSGARSGRAVQWLAQQGVDVVNVSGGMQAWAASGRPMVSERGTDPFVA